MIICNNCKSYRGDDECGDKAISPTNMVTGAKKCSLINSKGNCKYFEQSKRGLIFGIIGIVCIIGALIGTPIGLVKYSKYQKAMAYQDRVNQINMIEDARIIETEELRAEQKARIRAEQKAKFPAKIYKGTYNGKEFIVEEYETYRDK